MAAPYTRRALSSSALAVLLGLAGATCGDPRGGPGDGSNDDDLSSDTCRLEPRDCDGGAGGVCGDDRDCAAPLFCCDDDNNCGGGMCTADCRDDRDCPLDMLCEHDMCFYACDDDRDCAVGMKCEHDRTVCEY